MGLRLYKGLVADQLLLTADGYTGTPVTAVHKGGQIV